jgi:predicted site-specific integrase-resolvase
MKSKEVLELLQITRPTLTKYVKEGLIKVNILPNGRYDYDKDSVYKLFLEDYLEAIKVN